MLKNTCFLLIFTLFGGIAAAAEVPLRDWSELSDRDLSPVGKSALGTGPQSSWKHAETEHFVYHFTDPKQAETVYLHAEVYYGWIKELFGVSRDEWRKKAHVFVFHDKEAWDAFNARHGGVSEGNAFTNGWELFLYRDPFWLAPQKTLAHELTHVILFRFLEGPIPLFLNEGFAEFIAYRAVALKFDGDEYSIRTVEKLAEADFIPLDELSGIDAYPSNVAAFYRQSELFVRYLILQHQGPKFYEFLRRLSSAKGDFEAVLKAVYGFESDVLARKFEDFAVSKKPLPAS